MDTMKSTSESPSIYSENLLEHLLQSEAWGRLKGQFGWTPQRVQMGKAAAQILFKRLPLGFTIAYVPKGPTVDWTDVVQCQALFQAIHQAAKKQRAVFLKIEPNLVDPGPTMEPLNENQSKAAIHFLTQANFIPGDTIQPQSSLVVDISGDEAAILASMKQKTRYNIRLAQKKEVTIRCGDDADMKVFHELSRLTSSRDGFGVHSLTYYQQAYQQFAPQHCALLLAEFKGEPLAALMVFGHIEDAYYLYGASSDTHRNLMPTYLIQWEAIRWAKRQGYTRYDLWGIPNEPLERLEADFSTRSDGLWGVYRFKRGFGGQLVKTIGAFDFVYQPYFYKLYRFLRK